MVQESNLLHLVFRVLVRGGLLLWRYRGRNLVLLPSLIRVRFEPHSIGVTLERLDAEIVGEDVPIRLPVDIHGLLLLDFEYLLQGWRLGILRGECVVSEPFLSGPLLWGASLGGVGTIFEDHERAGLRALLLDSLIPHVRGTVILWSSLLLDSVV